MGVQKVDEKFMKELRALNISYSSANNIDNSESYNEKRKLDKNDSHLNLLKANYKKYNYLSNAAQG